MLEEPRKATRGGVNESQFKISTRGGVNESQFKISLEMNALLKITHQKHQTSQQ
jgi:hypothetical protein